jgi:ATP-dependent Clp protease ATP-binding subunit ClpA
MRMSEHGQRICELAEEAANTDDPESALGTLAELRRELDAFVTVHVRRALVADRSFADVARALGISRQAAHRRYRQLTAARPRRAERRLVATQEARRVMRLAYAETLASGATAAGSRHVLLGILRTDSAAARALQWEGVTLENARACAQAATSPDGQEEVDPNCFRRILKSAGRVAMARGDRHLKPEELLLAALMDPDGSASRTVTALGAPPASIRARLGC